MKKIGIIFLVSCLLSLMPIAFGAQNSVVEVGQLTLVPDSGYCYHKAQDRHATPLTIISQKGPDGFSIILDDIRKKTVSEIEKMQPVTDTFSLPIFTVKILNQTTDHTIQILDPSATATTYSSSALHKIFSGLTNPTDAVALMDEGKKIALLLPLNNSYNPGQMSQASPQELHATNITFSCQQVAAEDVYELKNINTSATNLIILEFKKKETKVLISLEQLEQLSQETYTENVGINDFATITNGKNEIILQLNNEIREHFKQKHVELTKNQSPEQPTTSTTLKPASRTFIQKFCLIATGSIALILGLYAASKLEYLNKNIAPSMEAKLPLLFTRLLDSWKNTSRSA